MKIKQFVEVLCLQTLAQIIGEVTEGYSDEAKVDASRIVNTNYALPYTVQYRESDFEFLRRLAIRHGEYFYYNGQQLVFGNKVQPMVTLEENIDLLEAEFDMGIKPQDFTFLTYDAQNGQPSANDSSSVRVQFKENPFQAVAVNASKSVFRKKAESHYNHTGIGRDTDNALSEAVRRERENRENLVTVRGRSKDPELRLGGRAKLVDINGHAMETYRVIEISHHHDGNEYYNEFVGIPDIFNAPYQDNDAVPYGEDQPARVLDNDDPMGMGRVRVQFPWQEKSGGKTPWIRLVQPHSGSGKGFHFIPEIGEEVLVGFESHNAEKPYVIGTHYNGAEVSSFHTAGNDLKVTKTRSGHTIIMDDSENKMSITILDQSGNTIYLDTVKKSITIQALESIDIICKNLNIKVAENMKTNVGHNQENTIGKNIKTTAKEEISQDSGKKTIIASGDNTEISARKDLDLYGKKNFIGYSDGKTEFGAKQQMHVYGANSLITAKDKIEYKAPSMNKLPENGKFEYDREPKIVDVMWLNDNAKEHINKLYQEEEASILVLTRNANDGEEVNVEVEELDEKGNLTINNYTGTANNEGQAILKRIIKHK